MEIITDYYDLFWTFLINVIGKSFFGIEQPLTLQFTGSGDRLYDWIWYFCVILLTLIIGTVFSIIDRKRLDYERLKSWLVFVLIYYLFFFLFVYGIIKLFYLQFIPLNLERLFHTFGQVSPMGLLWTFMGFSQAYTFFAGFCETIAGILLLFRKTRTLGAFISTGVMLNVFMLNMSYDVPVKLFSFQLMLIGIYLLSLDRKRIFAFFIFNKPVSPDSNKYPVIRSKRWKQILLGIQIIFVGFVVYSQISESLNGQKQYGSKREKSPLYGVYNIDTFIRNQEVIPPILSDTLRWKRVLFDYPTFASVIFMDDRIKRYDSKIDTLAQTVTFSLRGDTVNRYEFKYAIIENDLYLKGIMQNDTLEIGMDSYDLNNFGLLNRGFHWVSEVPYNRYNYNH